jgi:ketosteroid isomerase-like protein
MFSGGMTPRPRVVTCHSPQPVDRNGDNRRVGNLELLRERLGGAVEDPESFYEILHPDVVWDMSDTASPMAGLYRGKDEVRAFYRRWAGAFSNWSYDIERMIEAGEEVVVIVREHGHGRGSGVEVEMLRANIWTFENGKVVLFRSFCSPEAALQAAGLEPDG